MRTSKECSIHRKAGVHRTPRERYDARIRQRASNQPRIQIVHRLLINKEWRTCCLRSNSMEIGLAEFSRINLQCEFNKVVLGYRASRQPLDRLNCLGRERLQLTGTIY